MWLALLPNNFSVRSLLLPPTCKSRREGIRQWVICGWIQVQRDRFLWPVRRIPYVRSRIEYARYIGELRFLEKACVDMASKFLEMVSRRAKYAGHVLPIGITMFPAPVRTQSGGSG